MGDGYLRDDLKQFPSSVIGSQLSDAPLATLIMPEFGTAGVASLLLLFGGWVLLLPHSSPRKADNKAPDEAPLGREIVGMFAALTLVSITFYMMASNLGLLPLTGKSVPFLTVLSKSDLVFATVLTILAGGLGAYKKERTR